MQADIALQGLLGGAWQGVPLPWVGGKREGEAKAVGALPHSCVWLAGGLLLRVGQEVSMGPVDHGADSSWSVLNSR